MFCIVDQLLTKPVLHFFNKNYVFISLKIILIIILSRYLKIDYAMPICDDLSKLN